MEEVVEVVVVVVLLELDSGVLEDEVMLDRGR